MSSAAGGPARTVAGADPGRRQDRSGRARRRRAAGPPSSSPAGRRRGRSDGWRRGGSTQRGRRRRETFRHRTKARSNASAAAAVATSRSPHTTVRMRTSSGKSASNTSSNATDRCESTVSICEGSTVVTHASPDTPARPGGDDRLYGRAAFTDHPRRGLLPAGLSDARRTGRGRGARPVPGRRLGRRGRRGLDRRRDRRLGRRRSSSWPRSSTVVLGAIAAGGMVMSGVVAAGAVMVVVAGAIVSFGPSWPRGASCSATRPLTSGSRCAEATPANRPTPPRATTVPTTIRRRRPVRREGWACRS